MPLLKPASAGVLAVFLFTAGPRSAAAEPLDGGGLGHLSLRAAISRAAVQASAPSIPARRHDSLLNGVLIGAAIGALAGLVPDYYDDCEECHDSLYIATAVGAGIGLLVDALRMTPVTAPAVSHRPPRVSAGRTPPRTAPRAWILRSQMRF